MHKDERRALHRRAFLQQLETRLVAGQQQFTLPVTPSLIANIAPRVDGPFTANQNVRQDLWCLAADGLAGTGTRISDIYGAAHQNATEA